MAYCSFCKRSHNVGFISTRFAGTDGVSLEQPNGQMSLKGSGSPAIISPVSLIARQHVHIFSKKPISSIRILVMSFENVSASA